MASYLTLGQAAEKLGVVTATAKKWLKKLKPKKVGRELQYDKKVFEQWFKNMPERPKIGRPPGSSKVKKYRRKKASPAKSKLARVTTTRAKRARRKTGRRGKKLATAGPSVAVATERKAGRKTKTPRPTQIKKPAKKAAKPVAAAKPNGKLPDDAVSAAAFAKLVGCSGPSIYNWIKAGMPAHEVPKAKRTSYFVSPKEVANWLKRNDKISLALYAKFMGSKPEQPAAAPVQAPEPEAAEAEAAAAPFVPLSPLARELLKQTADRAEPAEIEVEVEVPAEAATASSEVQNPFLQVAAALTEALCGPGQAREQATKEEAEDLQPAGRTFAQLVEEAGLTQEEPAEEKDSPASYEHLLAGKPAVEDDGPASAELLEEEKPMETEETSDTITAEDLLSMNDAQTS